jgi:hypothetical protein
MLTSVCNSEPTRQRAGPDEPQIGDVGFVSQDDGAFCRLFNARMPQDHPWNAGIIPDNFLPIDLNEDYVRDAEKSLTKGAYLYASNVDKRMDAQAELLVTSFLLSWLVASLNQICIVTTRCLL